MRGNHELVIVFGPLHVFFEIDVDVVVQIRNAILDSQCMLCPWIPCSGTYRLSFESYHGWRFHYSYCLEYVPRRILGNSQNQHFICIAYLHMQYCHAFHDSLYNLPSWRTRSPRSFYSYSVFGKPRVFNGLSLFFTCVLNILILEIRYFKCLLTRPDRLVSITSSMATIKLAQSKSMRTIEHFSTSCNLLSPNLKRTVMHESPPFTYPTKATLAMALFGPKSARFFLGRGGRLFTYVMYFINIPTLMAVFYRLYDSRSSSTVDYFLAVNVLGWPPLLNMSSELIPRIYQNFEASFLTFNILFLLVGMTLMLRGSSKMFLPQILFPLLLSGVIADAHVVRRRQTRLNHAFTILSVFFLLHFGIFFGMIDIDDVTVRLAGSEFSIKERCLGCIANSIFITLRVIYKNWFYEDQFVFIKSKLRASGTDEATFKVLCQDIENIVKLQGGTN